jgi:ABC-type nitrate/sulfonate/bicarbonate transport system substrate-binding protein
MEPGPAAQAFVAGQNDAAMTYEPFLSAVRAAPQSGKIIATTLDYPMVMDTFGCTPAFIGANEGAVRALVKSYYEALDMIKADEAKAFGIMGADVKQSAEQFGNSAKFLRWQGPEDNSEVLLRSLAGILRQGRRPAAGDRPDQTEARHRQPRRHPLRHGRRQLNPLRHRHTRPHPGSRLTHRDDP